MLVLITYDVSVISEGGKKRLRNIAKICLDHGVRVQNSVFECEVTPAQFTHFKQQLLREYNRDEDSLRFYFLGKRGREKVEHHGTKAIPDPAHDTLIL